MAGSRDQDVHVLCKQLHPWKKVPPIGLSPAFPGTILWWPAHLSRVAQCFCLSSKLQGRNQTRDAALPPAAPGLGSASPPQGQAQYCAKFYFRQTFESMQARLAQVHSASLSHVQYFHSRIKSLVMVTGINTLASCDFSVRHLQFSRWHQVKLSA